MRGINPYVTSSIELPASTRNTNLEAPTPPQQQPSSNTATHTTSNSTPVSNCRLRSSPRLATKRNYSGNKSLLSSYVKPTRSTKKKGQLDVTTTSTGSGSTHSTTVATTNTTNNNNSLLPGQVRLFMDTVRAAMNTLMQDYGYSRERAKISILDQLVSLPAVQPPLSTVRETMTSMSTGSSPSSRLQSLNISDNKIFQCMKDKKIGMEHATIALTIEQTIALMLSDPNLSYTSMSEILDTWIKYLEQVQPKPLSCLTMKASSAFGTPLRMLHMSSTPSIATPQQQLEPTPSIQSSISTAQQSIKPPCTPASHTDAKAVSSQTRMKTGWKKSNKASLTTPPLSTITIPPISTSQQRSRTHSATEAVSAKITSSMSGMDGESSQHVPILSKSKPPLAPSTNGTSSTSGSVSASIGRATSTAASPNSNSKRTNLDSTRLEDQSESASTPLMNRGVRSASPSSLTAPSSNKRQRRSTSMSSGN